MEHQTSQFQLKMRMIWLAIVIHFQQPNNQIKAYVDNASVSSEQVQDIVGAMFTSNTETGITATYEDSDGTIDLVVSASSDVIKVCR